MGQRHKQREKSTGAVGLCRWSVASVLGMDSDSSRVSGRGLEAAVDYLRWLVGALISLSNVAYL